MPRPLIDRQRHDMACRKPVSDVVENLGKVSYTECTGQWNDYELIPNGN